MPAMSGRVERIFKENLGKKGVSPQQKEAVLSAAGGRDTLVVIPTGGGKTSIYQAVGLIRPGPTVVVSPLKIARQEQVESADEKDVPQAVDATSRDTGAGGKQRGRPHRYRRDLCSEEAHKSHLSA